MELTKSHADVAVRRGRRCRGASTSERIVDGCKVLSFRLARRRPFDPAELTAASRARGSSAIEALDGLLN